MDIWAKEVASTLLFVLYILLKYLHTWQKLPFCCKKETSECHSVRYCTPRPQFSCSAPCALTRPPLSFSSLPSLETPPLPRLITESPECGRSNMLLATKTATTEDDGLDPNDRRVHGWRGSPPPEMCLVPSEWHPPSFHSFLGLLLSCYFASVRG